MKIKLSLTPRGHFFICVLSLFTVYSCSLHKVERTPAPKQYCVIDGQAYDNGLPKQKQPWVVYSDRTENDISPEKKEMPYINYKKAEFLEPLIVLNKKNGMFKVAEYQPDIATNKKLFQIEKNLKVKGWIPEERLLLWTNSLKGSNSGFILKATITINDLEIINSSDKYFDNNSAIVYKTPALKTRAEETINVGSIVYIYKESEDKNFYLIGRKPTTKTENIEENIYGWVSKDVVSLWGERASLKIKEIDSINREVKISAVKKDTIEYLTTLNANDIDGREGVSKIFPLLNITSNSSQVKYYDNIFNYDNNKIYNVLGKPITYQKYREYRVANKKLNVVFVLDVSKSNESFLPISKSLLQELEFSFKELEGYSSVKFGGVVYKNNDCGEQQLYTPLTTDLKTVTRFFENKMDRMVCNDNSTLQPVDKGISAAAELLNNAKEESNIIIVMGATSSVKDQIKSVTNNLANVNARPIFFQTHSKSQNAYNNFVILAQQAVAESSKLITEAKKEKIVSQEDLLLKTNYNVTEGVSGIYSLNFPEESMTQGFVIFPNRDESMRPATLKTALDSLLVQVSDDNNKIEEKLIQYFMEHGMDNTYISDVYKELYPFKERLVPTSVASSLFNQDNAFLVKGFIPRNKDTLNPGENVDYGVFLNELEYEQLSNFYNTLTYEVFSSNSRFTKKRALRKYRQVVSKFSPTLKKYKKSELKDMPMQKIIQVSTGYNSRQDSLMHKTPKEWIKSNEIKYEDVFNYFIDIRDIAEELGGYKNDDEIKFEYKGQNFYWLSERYFPTLKIINVEEQVE